MTLLAQAIWNDRDAQRIGVALLAILVTASLASRFAAWRARTDAARATVANLAERVRAWWVMVLLFAAAMAAGRIGVVVLFGLISFLSLREVLTLTPTRRGDHRALFWAFFVAVPCQYVFVYADWYGMYSIFLPVYGFAFFAIRAALAGDPTRYLERVAKVQYGLMVSVYCISHAPALLMLKIPGYDGQQWKLVVFLVAVVQLSDVFQYVWGKLLGKHKIAPTLSPKKTVEGFVGGVLTAAAVGMALYWMTPFLWWQAGLLGLLVAVLGFFGGLVMSAIKRDAGVKDYGQLIEGHGGMTDRIDSLAFAAPVFFHIVRYTFS